MRLHKRYHALLLSLISSYATAQTSTSSVTFLYPTNSPIFNFNDAVVVVYRTPWALVDLTVNCSDTISSIYIDGYQTYDNPLPGNSMCIIEQIGNPHDLTGILDWPTLCWFWIQDNSAKTAHQAVGGNFTLYSTAGPRKTFSLGVSNPTSAGVTTTVQETTNPTSAGVTTTVQETMSPTSAATQSASNPAPVATSSSSSSSLSTGAKAGIGAGGGILVLIIIALALYLMVVRKRLKQEKIFNEPLRFSRASQDSRPLDRVAMAQL